MSARRPGRRTAMPALAALVSGFAFLALGLTQVPAPAAAACNCKYDAMCPSGYKCRTSGVFCAGKAMKGTCIPVVTPGIMLPNPAFTTPSKPAFPKGSGAPSRMKSQ